MASGQETLSAQQKCCTRTPRAKWPRPVQRPPSRPEQAYGQRCQAVVDVYTIKRLRDICVCFEVSCFSFKAE